jgi:D-tyrosyl-tRNA(Tyr) deacylase
MRAVVQRVSSASVTVGAEVAGRIGAGLLVLVGVGAGDGPDDVAYVAGKIADLRIFNDDDGKMNRSVAEAGGSVLIVSQFTLLGDCRRGRRPSFDAAGAPALAEALYEDVVRALRARGLAVATGVFRANMQVALVNDGPVTLLLDSTRGF